MESAPQASQQEKEHNQVQGCSARQTLTVAGQILRAGSPRSDALLHCRMLLQVKKIHRVCRREAVQGMTARMVAEESK